MHKKIQKFGHSFTGFGGQFENFHAWTDGLDVALSGGFVKIHGGGEIGSELDRRQLLLAYSALI
jgi:hypothetical protein